MSLQTISRSVRGVIRAMFVVPPVWRWRLLGVALLDEDSDSPSSILLGLDRFTDPQQTPAIPIGSTAVSYVTRQVLAVKPVNQPIKHPTAL